MPRSDRAVVRNELQAEHNVTIGDRSTYALSIPQSRAAFSTIDVQHRLHIGRRAGDDA